MVSKWTLVNYPSAPLTDLVLAWSPFRWDCHLPVSVRRLFLDRTWISGGPLGLRNPRFACPLANPSINCTLSFFQDMLFHPSQRLFCLILKAILLTPCPFNPPSQSWNCMLFNILLVPHVLLTVYMLLIPNFLLSAAALVVTCWLESCSLDLPSFFCHSVSF